MSESKSSSEFQPARAATALERPSHAPISRLTREDLRLFGRGRHYRLYEKMGAHAAIVDGTYGYAFAVWAPHAARVGVIGDFNDWGRGDAVHPLEQLDRSGVWSGFVPGVARGALYKYRIESRTEGYRVDKSDPFALRAQVAPETASMAWDLEYAWGDEEWLAARAGHDAAESPMSVYEMHLGSWMRPSGSQHTPSYREVADELIPYLERMGFTHVELLPPMEHPFYGSWGYQTTGYFAATSRYGEPQDLMQLIDRLHRSGIGVILDWVPSHFPTDEHGLCYFDGSYLFEYPDPKIGYHPDWKSHIFYYGRDQVRSFLISSALFWIERYHVDAIRVDAVASMLYLDYSRKEGEWIANRHGGRENLEAIAFLRQLNDAVHEAHPGVRTIAEESTAWPMVSRPEHLGGLGFDMKWDMGWMHDTLSYMSQDSIHRKYHHNALTFRMSYAYSENFVLSLSHDEVVHGKKSLLDRMFGDYWQKFANARALYGLQYALPGKKLLFMGAEIGQWKEWNHEGELDWGLLDYPSHAGLQRWIADLNRTHRDEPALHERDFDPAGFRWVDCSDADQSVVSFLRSGHRAEDTLLAVLHFTPVPRYNYRVGVPTGGHWVELLNSDAETYGGSGVGNLGSVQAVPMRYHDQPFSVVLTLPPLSMLLLKQQPHEAPAPGARKHETE